MSCSPLKINRRFGGICRFNFQDLRINQAGNKHEAGRLIFIGTLGVVSVIITLYITAVKTSNSAILI
jgi:hypothetical protein